MHIVSKYWVTVLSAYVHICKCFHPILLRIVLWSLCFQLHPLSACAFCLPLLRELRPFELPRHEGSKGKNWASNINQRAVIKQTVASQFFTGDISRHPHTYMTEKVNCWQLPKRHKWQNDRWQWLGMNNTKTLKLKQHNSASTHFTIYIFALHVLPYPLSAEKKTTCSQLPFPFPFPLFIRLSVALIKHLIQLPQLKKALGSSQSSYSVQTFKILNCISCFRQ